MEKQLDFIEKVKELASAWGKLAQSLEEERLRLRSIPDEAFLPERKEDEVL